MRRVTSRNELMVVALVVAAASTVLADVGDENDPWVSGDIDVLARWNGGTLTRARFVEIYDPSRQAITRAGEAYTRELCKAVFQEIYAPIGERLDLDQTPEVKEILDDWERERLANLFIERYGPTVSSPPTAASIQRYYDDHLDDYAIRPTVHLQVLFVACNSDEIAEGACGDRMARMLERLSAGEVFLDLAVEERGRSGNANGEFSGVFLTQLAPELVEAIKGLPASGVSEVVESPRGLFLLRVVGWGKTGFIPIDRVTTSIRQGIAEEELNRWRSVELVRLRTELSDVTDSASDDDVLVAAAMREGLHRSPSFVEEKMRHRAWTLADAAFVRDLEILPDDKEIGLELIAAGELSLADRHYDLVIELIPEAGVVDADTNAVERAAALRNASGSLSDHGDDAPGESVPHRVDLERIRGGDLGSWSHEVSIALDESRAGEWLGPFRVEKGPLEDPEPGVGLETGQTRALTALVGVKRVWVPVSDEQRRQANRRLRNRITTVDVFLSVFSNRWELVIFSPDHGGSDVSASNGYPSE